MNGLEGMDDLVQDFLVESYEGLDQLDQDFVALEAGTSPEVLAAIFRTVHTIKGSAGFLGLSQLERLAHSGESLLHRLREGELTLTAPMTTAMLQMVDGFRQILGCVEADRTEGTRSYDGLVYLLDALKDGLGSDLPPLAPTEPAPPAESAPVEAASAEEAPAAEEASADALPAAEQARLAAIARLQAEQPTPAPAPSASAPPAPALQSDPPPDAAPRTGDAPRAAPTSVADSSIRVDVGLLDELMNLVGELVLARNQVLQFNSTLRDQAFLNTTQRLNLITTSLQEKVMKTRMQPIAAVWNKVPRVVRDLAVAVGKQVDVIMDGAETELDKTIIEAIKDPMTHLIRNSVDHGIEAPEVRADHGKAPTGTVSLRAYHEGGQVVIEIGDDGAGIDPDRLRTKAVEKGLLTVDQAARLGDRDALNLIFVAGFSTAEKVSNISGRGVGMDVVRTNIEKIGGTIDLQSTLGEGTTVTVKIPLTLAIIPGLMVSAGGDRYAIPQVSVQEIVRLKGDGAGNAIESVHGAPVYRLRGRLLPLVFLDQILGVDQPDVTRSVVRIVVLNAGDVQFGLVVDEVNDTEEIVVKPLGEYFQNSLYAGCTIMGDGRVAVILDVASVAERAKVSVDGHRHDDEAAHADHDVETERMLVVRLVGDRRMAVPLDRVVRLETFESSAIEHSGGQPVVQYRGGLLPLVGLDAALDEVLALDGDRTSRRHLSVVVCSDQDNVVGVVVDKVLDVVDHEVAVHEASRHDGEFATAVIQERVTDILDIARLVDATGVALFHTAEVVSA
jgi:two-component system chemotaxis sensor kinase CheA